MNKLLLVLLTTTLLTSCNKEYIEERVCNDTEAAQMQVLYEHCVVSTRLPTNTEITNCMTYAKQSACSTKFTANPFYNYNNE